MIFYLSYIKISVQVLKKIGRLQRDFLWGGRRGSTRIPWIKCMWKEVIKCKYGESAVGEIAIRGECKPWFASLWWKDIFSIGSNLNNDWFVQNMVKIHGDSTCTRFWIGNNLLKVLFPCLYSISIQKEATIANIHSDDITWQWRLAWRRRLFVWEDELLLQLLELINPITLSIAGDP
jgi:hypothetical protein